MDSYGLIIFAKIIKVAVILVINKKRIIIFRVLSLGFIRRFISVSEDEVYGFLMIFEILLF